MASLVEIQGSIPRQQDFQILKQSEDQKPLVDHTNFQQQVDKNVEQTTTEVHQKDNASQSGDRSEDDRESRYYGDGGRRRKTKDGVIIKKDPLPGDAPKTFDFKI